MPKYPIKAVSCKYGAPLGRYSSKTYESGSGKISVHRVKMSGCGAYDEGGAYWGCASSWKNILYRAAWPDPDGDICELFVRASSRDEAIGKVSEQLGETAAFLRCGGFLK